jgi:hypothetical protein
MKKENQFQEFCRKNIFCAFVLFGIGLSLPLLSKYSPESFENWTSFASLFITIPAAIVLAIGLLTEERKRKSK